MSADKFDQELGALYQQRKKQVVAPALNLDSPVVATKPVRSLLNMLILLVTGGAASFGILAVITQFAKPPVHGENGVFKQHSVRIVQLPKVVKAPEIVVLKEQLPPKPEVKVPVPQTMVIKERTPTTVLAENLALKEQQIPDISVPKIVAPILTLNPIHRVTPKYPKKAIVERLSGQVKLSYKIANDGIPTEIEILNSSSHRLLEQSAKQALSQWRYPINQQSDDRLEIMFEFNLAKVN
jgi:protein TonB